MSSESCCGHNKALRELYFCAYHRSKTLIMPGHCEECGAELVKILTLEGIEHRNGDPERLFFRLLMSLIFGLPFFSLKLVIGSCCGDVFPLADFWFMFCELFFVVPLIIWASWSFLVKGVKSIFSLNFNMFTLLTISISMSLLYSVVVCILEVLGFFYGFVVYFDTAFFITVFMLFGQLLERKAQSKVDKVASDLLDFRPKMATWIGENNRPESIAVFKLLVGDLFILSAGDIVPADGCVIDGFGYFDESMFTGECVNIFKGLNSSVMAGSRVLSGELKVKVTKVGLDTIFSKILLTIRDARFVSDDQCTYFVSVASKWFVPCVLLVAFTTFLTWGMYIGDYGRGFVCAISVLAVACPCALGLSAPMSIVFGLGRSSRIGIFVKNAKVLELFPKIRCFCFDKTGTLTFGRHLIDEMILVTEEYDERQILTFAASLGVSCGHFLASELVSRLEKFSDSEDHALLDIEIDYTGRVQGSAVCGRIGGLELVLGNAELMGAVGADVSKFEHQNHDGKIIEFLSINKTVACVFVITDKIRPQAAEVIRYLDGMHVATLMLTGDSKYKADKVASEVGIKRVYSRIMPQDKQRIVRECMNESKIVAMVGDGVNDAPAIADANVGVAMGDGTDTAISSSDIVLLSGDLTGIVKMFGISRIVMRNIKQNVCFAFLYNLIGIFVATGVLSSYGINMSPVFSAFAMSLSSISVILNAWRVDFIELRE